MSPEYKSADDQKRRELIGEEIYSYIEFKSSTEDAGKITGMIIDLPLDVLETISDIKFLNEKIAEGQKLLKED